MGSLRNNSPLGLPYSFIIAAELTAGRQEFIIVIVVVVVVVAVLREPIFVIGKVVIIIAALNISVGISVLGASRRKLLVAVFCWPHIVLAFPVAFL